jgi:MoaA/NifB/PqqE/SkfB family radical SAM enzyme
MSRYLTVKRIEFAVTYLCNSRCRHCQLGEEEERKTIPSQIDGEKAARVVREISKEHQPTSIMTFGGEPLLYPEAVCAIHKEAMNVGIPRRDVITNGFWSGTTRKTEKIAGRLVESGVNEVHISVDCFHQEFVPLKTVRKTAKALLRVGMTRVFWNPCWIVSKNHDNPYNRKTRSILEKLSDLQVESSEGNNVQPEGRATKWLKDFLPPRTQMPNGRCGDMPYTEPLDAVHTVCVEPDGRIAVCKGFYIGNAFETKVTNIMKNYDPFKIPEAKAIIEKGMNGLVDWARSRNVRSAPDGYYNVCHQCTDLRRRVSNTRCI